MLVCITHLSTLIHYPDFVGLQVRDLAASRRFYEKTLGLAVAPQGPPNAVVFMSEPIPFAVREPDVDLDAVERPGWGVALWMRCEEADGMCADLEEDGVETAQEPFDGPFGRTFAFVDPDSYIVTAHEQ